MTPYIITTSEPFDAAKHSHRPAFTQVAAASLEDARDVGSQIADDHLQPRYAGAYRSAFDALPESGGTVGPLPDGTVIEVARVEWIDLATPGFSLPPAHDEFLPDYIAAFNDFHAAQTR